MPATLLQPGVYIEEIPSGVRTITGVATSITLFVGWAPRGPIDRALRLTSFADYERAYGGLDRRSLLGYACGTSTTTAARTPTCSASPTTADPPTAACDIGDLHIEASSPGAWAHTFSVRLTRRADDATRFRLEVIQPANNDAVLESFANLSMTATDPRFAPAVVNGRSAFMDDLRDPRHAGERCGRHHRRRDGTVIGPADAFRTALPAPSTSARSPTGSTSSTSSACPA